MGKVSLDQVVEKYQPDVGQGKIFSYKQM